MATDQIYLPPALQQFSAWRYGAAGLFNETWRDQKAVDPKGRFLVMCFDLRFGDEVVRVCTSAEGITTTSAKDGKSYSYRPLAQAQPDINLSYTLGQASSQATTLSPVAVPSDVVDGLGILRRGRLLAGFGEVSLQWDGMDHDQRIVFMKGDMDNGVQGGPSGIASDQFLSTSLSDPKATADVNLTPWVVDLDRWSAHDVRFAGKRYPLVVNKFTDVPALLVDTNSNDWLVCYGHGWTINTTTGVRIKGGDPTASTDATFGWSQTEVMDALGVPVTVIRFTGTHTWDGTETVHVTVTGGKFADDLIGAIRFVAQGFTGLGSEGQNKQLYAAAQKNLYVAPSVMVNASGGGGAAKALQWIEGGLLRGFPQVSMVFSRGGYGPIVTDRRAESKRSLIAGVNPLIGRALRWSEGAKTSIFNDFTIRYDFDVVSNAYRGVATRHPGNNDLCRLIESWSGRRSMAPIESPYITDPATAESVADWLVDHMTLPPLFVEYPCSPWLVLEMERGDNIDLTDDWFGWTDVKATVRSLKFKKGLCSIGFYVWERYYQIGGASVGRYVGSAS